MQAADTNTKEIMGATLMATPECGLSDKMCEALLWIAEGKSNEEIGLILGVSTRAVKARARAIMDRLDAVNRTQLVAKAFVVGVLHGVPALLLAVIICGPGAGSDVDKMRNVRRVAGRRTRDEYLDLLLPPSGEPMHPTPNLEFV